SESTWPNNARWRFLHAGFKKASRRTSRTCRSSSTPTGRFDGRHLFWRDKSCGERWEPMNREPTENDLLVEFERQQIPEHYKPYYLPKRHNLFATIQQFPYVWNCFMHLDKIVLREFEVMQRLREPILMLPMVLLMNAHSKV